MFGGVGGGMSFGGLGDFSILQRYLFLLFFNPPFFVVSMGGGCGGGNGGVECFESPLVGWFA